MYNGLLEIYVLLCPTDRDMHLSATTESAKNIFVVGSCHREPWHCGVDGKKLYFRINIILLISFHPLKNFKLGLLKPYHFLLDRNWVCRCYFYTDEKTKCLVCRLCTTTSEISVESYTFAFMCSGVRSCLGTSSTPCMPGSGILKALPQSLTSSILPTCSSYFISIFLLSLSNLATFHGSLLLVLS